MSSDLQSPTRPAEPDGAAAREPSPPVHSTQVGTQRLYRWGLLVARRRRLVLAAGVLVLLICAGLYPALQHSLGAPNPAVQGSEAVRTEQILARDFPEVGSEDDAVVFYSRAHTAGQPSYRHAVAAVVATLRRQAGVGRVLSPFDANAVAQISSDEHAAYAVMALNGSIDQRFSRTAHLQQLATDAAGASGVQTSLVGISPVVNDLGNVERADTARAEAIGLPLALLVLLFATGSLIAATLPLCIAICGLLLTYGALALVSSAISINSTMLAIVAMLGLGIGVDYALFVTDRFRAELARARLKDEDAVADAVGVALATSGRTIAISGAIMVPSLGSLLLVRMAFCREIAAGALLVVLCSLLVALTLLPALLALLGPRIDRLALPARLQPAGLRPEREEAAAAGGWARWAQLLMRRPGIALAATLTLLIFAATPILDIRYGLDLGVLANTQTDSGRGERVLQRSFEPGLMAPIQIVVRGGRPGNGPGSVFAGAKRLAAEVEADPRVNAVVEGHRGRQAVVFAVTSVRVDSAAATALVRHIRGVLAPRIHADGGPTVLVGGATAHALDITEEMRSKLPLVMLLTFALSGVLLLLVFRSVILPLKAILMNLLSIGATIGVVVYVFQQGHGEQLLGFTSTGFVQALVPLMVFAVLFGLSMDYEVFLLCRIQEEWRKTHDNRLAVATGVQRTARPITAAAAIMVAIFGSFLVADVLEVKQLGFALALAVALDATILRLVLVPAFMRLLGAWNWWLPAPLARLLPGGEQA